MVRIHRWDFTRVTAIGTVIVLLSGCTSWRDYFHQGFKVGPDYQYAPRRSRPTGSTRPTHASARSRPIRADGGTSFTTGRYEP